ncbi:MAG: AraC family transcriptional regulator [Eubacterium sp.]|nr:AraC family transcriptional regulator [Eubacterium sp.]
MEKDYSKYYYQKMPDQNFYVHVIKRDFKGQGNMKESHWHEHIQFYYFTEGDAVMICNSQRFKVHAKDFVVVNSNELHYAESLSDTLSCYIIRVDFSFLFSSQVDSCQTKFIAPLSNNLITFQNLIQNDKQICNCIEKITEEYFSKEMGFELAIKSYLYQLIVVLLRKYVKCYLSQKEFEIRARDFTRMKQVLEYIDNNFTQMISINDLAAIANVSNYHFCKLFKKVTGKSTIDYINNLRVNKAILLLNDDSLNITEIALTCGFCDSNYFSRVFKKYKGIAPFQWKKTTK